MGPVLYTTSNFNNGIAIKISNGCEQTYFTINQKSQHRMINGCKKYSKCKQINTMRHISREHCPSENVITVSGNIIK